MSDSLVVEKLKLKRKRKTKTFALWDKELTNDDIEIILEMFKKYNFSIDENLIRHHNDSLIPFHSDVGRVKSGIGFMKLNSKNDELIGFALCYDTILNNSESVFEIIYLFIIPKFRNKHIGKDLISKCEEEAKKRQHNTLVAYLSTETQGFWEKMKFSIHITNTNTGILMKKEI
ncbi:hypothetical protein LCGC14_2925340 [marine sediment metagenome]|uniref:N-acetyltransferase domain-containing protein n=1 Tax=marine sediment metagenome TaxID=412755 RepID=A0A0F8XMU6_9ZZZZ